MIELVLTIIGRDRAGVVAELADVVRFHEGNWKRSELAEIAGTFAGVVVVQVDDDHADELLTNLLILREQGLHITAQEIARWEDISRRMFVPFHDDGIISQFEGYEKLREFDWQRYRARYGNIQRLDLILESEGDSANRYQLGKQADVLMLFYLFSAEELGGLFERLEIGRAHV